MLDLLNQFATNHPWVPLALSMWLLFAKIVKDVRDVFDKTPETDDNLFEKAATFIGKLSGALVGIRPTAPASSKPASAKDAADATGVKVK